MLTKSVFTRVMAAFMVVFALSACGSISNAHAATKAQSVGFLLSQVRNASGSLAGGKVYFYEAGTSTLKNVWLDRGKQTPAANPYTLDSNGTAAVFCDGLYRIVIKTSALVTVYDRDNISIKDASNLAYDVDDYASLAAAVASIGSTPTTLQFAADVTLAANLVIPSTLELMPLNGAVINHGAYTINYAGSTARWPLTQIFNGTGAVTLTGAEYQYAEWFATNATPGTTNMTTAINAAINSKPNGDAHVKLLATSYAVSATLTHTLTEAPVIIQGSGNYESSKGTRIKWIGGNSDSIVALPAYGTIEDVFIYNGNAATTIIGIDLIGTDANNNRANCRLRNVTVKSCAIGYAFDWSWNNHLDFCWALYNGTGFDLRTEANAITCTSCVANANGIGITDKNGSGARGVTWNGGAIQLSTTVGLDYGTINVSSAWVFTGTYFEGNAQTAKLAKIITIKDAFINGDGVSAGNPAFDITGSRGVRLENIYPAGSIASLVTFSGADAAYIGQSVYITAPYHQSVVAKALYDNPKPLSLGWMHPTCYVKVETGWVDTASANNSAVSIVGENFDLAERRLVAMYMVNKSSVVFAAPFTVGMGRLAGYVDLATATFSTSPLAVGTRNVPLVGTAPAAYTSSVYSYFTSSTANSGGGSIKFVMFFI